jgi:hypothetical protein
MDGIENEAPGERKTQKPRKYAFFDLTGSRHGLNPSLWRGASGVPEIDNG